MDMGPVKGVLKEELINSRKLKKRYERELKKLPKGCLVRKNISGHTYYYLAFRDGAKVKYVYRGKMTAQEIKKYERIKKDRKKYRDLLCETKKQILFLERTLKIGS